MEKLQPAMKDLTADKRAALLAQIRKKKRENPQRAENHEVHRQNGQDCYSLSFSQSRLWFIDQLYPESIMYNFPFAYRIQGSLNITLLEMALNEIIKRHEVLRTAFHEIDHEPKQVIIPELQVKIEIDDLSGVSPSEKEKAALDIARKHAEIHFILNETPLIRCKLIVLSEAEFIFVTTAHHIVFDGWSMNVFLKELSEIYNAFHQGTQPTLSSLRIQYADYAESLYQWFCGAEKERQLDYWKKQLGDDISVVEFPADKPRPQMITSHGDWVNFELSPEVTYKLRQYASAHTCTLNMVTLAAFNYLIYRYTLQSKIRAGLPVSNRKTLETQDLIGLFVNTLVLSTDIDETMTFAELLEKVKQTVLGALENQEMPFEKLIEEYQIERDTSRNVLIQIMYNYMNVPKASLTINGAMATDYPLGKRSAMIEVLLSIEEDQHQVRGHIEYNKDLYQRTTIERILKQYQEILKNIDIHGTALIKDVQVLPADETQLLLHQFNATGAQYPREKTVAQLFEEQVKRAPDNVAVVFEDQRLTYRELNAKANALGFKLRALGVQPDDFVGIMAERSLEMIAGIYGIIKSGGAYLPIDPSYPEDRIEYMLRDCNPKVILTYKAACKTEIPVINLEVEDAWEGPREDPEPVNKPNDLLYIIYTSGTTGRPKGVAIENRSVINYSADNEYGVMKEALRNGYRKIISVTNLTFDIFVTEVILALLHGMTSFIANKDEQETAFAFSQLQEKHGAEILQTTPSRIKIWLSSRTSARSRTGVGDRENLGGLERLKYIMLGGEKVETSLVRELQKHTGAQIINVYGPSETTVWSTRKYVDLEKISDDIPIGQPISNTQIYILNGMNLCGVGMPGELCIAGDGLARGYLNKPELTAEKFVVRAFRETPQRIYRTGDLARWAPDGNIQYLGRMDEQVKIRGFRIELGEIESALRRIGDVNDAAVIVRADPSGEKAIYAYFVSDHELTNSGIQDALKKSLPEYMIPSYLMRIEKIPVTRNGKLDKRALPDITAKSEREYVAPGNREERMICNIFAEVLGLAQVGIQDNFFELGGHSLKATQVIHRIESETGIKIPLKAIFEHRTVEALAKVARDSGGGAQYVPIPKAEEKDVYPMAPVQKRLFLINEIDDTGVAYNIPQAFRIDGEINPKKLTNAIQELINRHEILRTSFHIENGQPIQSIHSTIKAEIEELDLRLKTGEEQTLILSKFVRPFKLSQAPLMRVGIAKAERSSILLFDMHHIISDGVSSGIFIKEFIALYNGEELKPLRIQYKDYSEWMRGRDISVQKEYWINEFKEEAPVIDLPYDKKRPPTQNFNGSAIEASLNREIKAKIRAFCAKTGTTEYMLLLAGFMVLLAKYSGQEEIIVGSPISGRIHKDTEDILGAFINTLAMRGGPEAQKIFNTFLNEVKESCLKAYENQEYPFEELIDAIQVQRDISRNPLFDVMLVFQNYEKAEINIEGNKGVPVNIGEHTTAKMDLTVYVVDVEAGYALWIEYCTDLFRPESIERMFRHFEKVLQEILENPNRKIGEIEAVTGEEKQQIIECFNNTYAKYPSAATVARLFEEQVKRAPDNVAVVFEDQRLTYRELNMRANALGFKLRGLGVQPDDFVGIMAERSIEMIIGIYGIIKSGGAYLPIDPSYPEDRIEYMLRDCNPKVILSYKAACKTEIPVINLEAEDAWEGPREDPEPVNKPNDLLYIIYTSGTTGRPKGVAIENRSVINYSADTEYGVMKEAYRNGYRKIISVTNLTFDIFVTEVILALLHGMTSFIANKDEQETAFAFSQLQEKHGAEILQTTPSRIKIWLSSRTSARSLMGAGDRENLGGLERLKYIMLGGEKVETSLVSELQKHTGAQIINVYGPSETTVWSTRKYVDLEGISDDIPIGQPISNTQIYILNGMNLCGVGMPGELCIAGDGLARGYLNKPELTAEKFIEPLQVKSCKLHVENQKEQLQVESCELNNALQQPSTFNLQPSTRVYPSTRFYRTGDLARWAPDGNIQYLGRIDEQVKIRGFRIELGEIESALRRIGDVKDAAVIVRADPSGEKAIYAYFVSDHELTNSGIRDALKKSLPEYMIPSYLMRIEKIPVTRNGKLDKRALPDITAKSEREYVAPGNREERIICNIFAEVLGLAQVGIKDNFFELGGHSLKATQVIHRIESETGIKILLKAIFEHRTVEALAKVVRDSGGGAQYVPIPKAKEKDFYPITPTLKRMYLLSQLQGASTVDNVPQAYEVRGEINIEKLTGAIQSLISRHEILRTSFHMENDIPVQRIHTDVKAEIQVTEMGRITFEAQKKKFLEFVRPFDLSKAPLLRIDILKSEGMSVLLMDMHHIITDGISMGIFINEFNALYNGEELKPLTVQYKDWSEWMREKEISTQKEYWVNVFSVMPPLLDLPYDYPRPPMRSFHGSSLDVFLDQGIREKISILGNKTGTTEHMVLLAGFMVLLAKYGGQDDIVIGSPFSGRTHQDMDLMMGMFVNTLALRGRPKAEKTFLHFLQELKDICLQAAENQEYTMDELLDFLIFKFEHKENAFEHMVKHLLAHQDQERPPGESGGGAPEGLIPRNPLYDIMFILNNNDKTEFNFGGNKARYISMGGDHTVAAMDLVVHTSYHEGGYLLWIEYSTDLFKPESLKRMFKDYEKILEEAFENPNRKIGEIEVLS